MTINSKDFKAQEAAFMTIDWLNDAKKEVDTLFGEGYAKKNPGLLGSFIQAASIKYHASNSNEGMSAISSSLDDILETLNLNGAAT